MSKVYLVTNIDFCVEAEDAALDVDRDKYGSDEEYENALEDRVDEICSCLEDEYPELEIEIDDEDLDDDELMEVLADKISEETGWLVYDFDADEVDEY